MFDDLDPPKKETAHRLGNVLDNLSVGELQELLEKLDQEKSRVQAEIDRKKASSDAASAIFKT